MGAVDRSTMAVWIPSFAATSLARRIPSLPETISTVGADVPFSATTSDVSWDRWLIHFGAKKAPPLINPPQSAVMNVYFRTTGIGLLMAHPSRCGG